MTVRATARGPERSSLDGTTADVLICGASFAGLAVARELAGCGASVLIVDRYELGERPTSACATPTPWLQALDLTASIRQEIPHMRFTTPHGSVRYRLPWSWAAFDYRHLCRLLYAQSDARFETATVQRCVPPGEARGGDRAGARAAETIAGGARAAETIAGGARAADVIAVQTDRGVLRARLVVDALGWRRVLGASGFQPPDAPLSRGLEVHPQGHGEDLEVWLERPLVRRGYGWRVPADGEARVGVASYAPAQHVRAGPSSWPSARGSSRPASRATGFRTVCGRRRRTRSSSSAIPPGTASPSRVRGSALPSTSGSPVAASLSPCSSSAARALTPCAAMTRSARRTVARSRSPRRCSG